MSIAFRTGLLGILVCFYPNGELYTWGKKNTCTQELHEDHCAIMVLRSIYLMFKTMASCSFQAHGQTAKWKSHFNSGAFDSSQWKGIIFTSMWIVAMCKEKRIKSERSTRGLPTIMEVGSLASTRQKLYGTGMRVSVVHTPWSLYSVPALLPYISQPFSKLFTY